MALPSVIRRWHFREPLSIGEICHRTGLSRNTTSPATPLGGAAIPQACQQLYEALQDEDEEKTADILRSLLDKIVLTPVEGKVEIDVRGDLAGIPTIAAQTQTIPGLVPRGFVV